MSKKMLINASHPEENRVAIVVDGILSELDIEIAGQEQTKGNIYKAVVTRVESGLQAAFVDYGAEKMGFLQIGEIHPNIYPAKENQDPKNRPRINEILQRGQEILVQIVKEERGTKGAALTTFLSLPGRYMVLMPDSKTKGVSRKIIEESERKQLKKTMAELNLPERMGYIVRTAGIGKEQEELKRDFDYLVSLYQGILNRKDQVTAPAQLYQESNLVIRSIRDYFSNEIDEVLIDDSNVYKEAKDFFSLVMPEQSGLVKQHRERRPIFSRFQIEEQIDGLARNQIPLPSGGSIVIDQTEALVAIDVNSGKMSSESGIEATAGKTNLEAAVEVGRQLRLRDLGGLIVIDFIDMRDRKRIRDVEHTLRGSLRDDKAKVTVGRISQFGLLEMSRQRIKGALSVGAYIDCPHCQGKGRIKSVEAQAVAFLRQAHSAASKGQITKIETRTPLDVATFLLNEKRSALGELEKQLNLTISIEGRPEFVPGQIEMELHKREKQQDQDKEQPSSPISHANQIEDALAAANLEKTEPEIPAEPVESADASVSVESVENVEENTGRKRRRRRRRRGGRKESDEQQVGSETAENSTDKELPSETKEVAEAVTSDNAIKGNIPVETTETTKPKPRSRRGSRKPAAKNSEVAVKTDSEVNTEVAPTTKTAAREKTTEPSLTVPQTKSVVAQEKTETTETATNPKRRAPRKPAAKKNPVEQPTETTEVTGTEPATQKTDPKEAEIKPKRRAPRKSPAKKATTEQSETPATKEQGTKSTSDEIKPEEKPKRRAPRKSTPKKTSEAEQQKDSASSNAEEKPKRKTTPRKSLKKETAVPESVEADESKASKLKTEEKPQRKTTKKTAAKAEAQPVKAEEKSSVKIPKARTTKKPAAPKATKVSASTGEAPVDPTPKKRTPRKTAAKKVDTTPATTAKSQSSGPESTKAESKPKRRAPRKKTPQKVEGPSPTE